MGTTWHARWYPAANHIAPAGEFSTSADQTFAPFPFLFRLRTKWGKSKPLLYLKISNPFLFSPLSFPPRSTFSRSLVYVERNGAHHHQCRTTTTIAAAPFSLCPDSSLPQNQKKPALGFTHFVQFDTDTVAAASAYVHLDTDTGGMDSDWDEQILSEKLPNSEAEFYLTQYRKYPPLCG